MKLDREKSPSYLLVWRPRLLRPQQLRAPSFCQSRICSLFPPSSPVWPTSRSWASRQKLLGLLFLLQLLQMLLLLLLLTLLFLQDMFIVGQGNKKHYLFQKSHFYSWKDSSLFATKAFVQLKTSLPWVPSCIKLSKLDTLKTLQDDEAFIDTDALSAAMPASFFMSKSSLPTFGSHASTNNPLTATNSFFSYFKSTKAFSNTARTSANNGKSSKRMTEFIPGYQSTSRQSSTVVLATEYYLDNARF